ncbi:MAG: 23S rRNA (uracil(1939)-C(5))-methyltransferase RlmD [Eubacteriales bacterium]|nr:23S rRNA (uracil(1939)-C(5))-methyltransferase RlmD [Eubacteriales bacterium]
MTKNEEFEILITDISDEGAGIGKTSDGFIWFIKDSVPGDRVLAAATKVKKSYGFGRVVRIIEGSPDRIESRCPVARPCGGCQIQALGYDAQLKFKAGKVKSCLERIGGFSDFSFEDIIGMEEPWRYRNKAQYPVASKNGEIITGFYAGHTHSVISCEDCLIGDSCNGLIMKTVTEFLKEKKISAYNEETGKGLVRHVLIRTSHSTGEIMVCLVINGDKLPQADILTERLASLSFDDKDAVTNTDTAGKKSHMITSVMLCVNKDRTNVIMGEKVINLFGPGFITDSILGVKFKIGPLSFFQVNPVQVEKLYSKALEYAGLTGNESVWDLYCGVGTITLCMAGAAREVLGVEIIPEAIYNAKENAGLNNIDNAKFYVGKAEEIVTGWTDKHPDVICVDPPRKGCDEKCLETILKVSPERVVYVSCNPATLARDLKILCEGGYRLEKVCPVDLFPHTVHVETVVLLSKGEVDSKKIRVEFSLEDMDMSEFQDGATYPQIKEYVLEHTGLKVSNLYISQIKRKCGIEVGKNYNLPKSEDSRQPQCPPEKEKAIREAFKYFGMI